MSGTGSRSGAGITIRVVLGRVLVRVGLPCRKAKQTSRQVLGLDTPRQAVVTAQGAHRLPAGVVDHRGNATTSM